MKKLSKRLTMIVAILLSLVLLSSSVVSTTLAKYVVTKSTTTTVGLEKFGVTVTLTGFGTADTSKTKTTGDSVSMTHKAAALTPSTTNQTIKASIAGKPTVPTLITIDISVTYNGAGFKIAEGAFTNIAANTVYIPFGFKVAGATKDTVAAYSNSSATDLEKAIEEAIEAKSDKFTRDDTNKKVVTTTSFPAGTEIGLSNLNIVINWPKTDSDDLNSKIGTYLANSGSTMSITYTITVEQDTTPTQS